ncbi:FixH family protein [Chitinophaga solisilvae]|uniref:Uncharacterized protein n=1 Tax=Chitinophaga solisilvae TaxID=1233460 RepID=A0A3S1BLF5_9BACT|nr:FixH family protein [Chitinophaga solisilvae]NSL89384.1 hypothetical protein [Chitinophaga solisilvae]
MNWGHKIIIVFIVFAAGILTLVVKSMRTKIDMVTADYYGEELKYQQVIDGKKNVQLLSAPVSITMSAGEIALTFPDELRGRQLTGRLQFYRPSDSGKDVELPLALNSAGQQKIERQLLSNGKYQVKMQWVVNGKPYYQEQFLNIY